MQIDYDKLKAEALASPLKRSRIIMVPGFDMVICLQRSSYIQMHRHPKYEAYHVMEGELEIENHDFEVVLRTPADPILCIPAGSWHEPRARTEFVIYREFYCGPFEKARDVEYAAFARESAA